MDGQSDTTMRIEEALRREGMYVGTVVGTSMWPMLRNRRDTIVVHPADERLRRFDVALYCRGDDYVLHRVVRVNERSYDILGDNCQNVERDIADERVIGVLTGFFRDDKPKDLHSRPYRAYVRVWHAIFPLRRALMRARSLAGRAKRKLVGRVQPHGAKA